MTFLPNQMLLIDLLTNQRSEELDCVNTAFMSMILIFTQSQSGISPERLENMQYNFYQQLHIQ